MQPIHRQMLFLLVIGCMLIALILPQSVGSSIKEGAENAVPEWAKQAYKSGQSCPAIVSQCLLPDMIDDLNGKITHVQNLIDEYTKEIVDIENRYPITFQINRVDVSNVYLDTMTNPSQSNYSSWVTGVLPYPQLSFVFPVSPQGLPGDKGLVGNDGLSVSPATALVSGLQGPPGYFGVPK